LQKTNGKMKMKTDNDKIKEILKKHGLHESKGIKEIPEAWLKHMKEVNVGERNGKKIKMMKFSPPFVNWYDGDTLTIRDYNNRPFVVFWFLFVTGTLLASFLLNVFVLVLLIPFLYSTPNPFKFFISIRFFPVLSCTYKFHRRFSLFGLEWYFVNYKFFSPRSIAQKKILAYFQEIEKRIAERTV